VIAAGSETCLVADVQSLLLLLLLVVQVFMLPSDRRLDEATLQEILVSGHSRIPLHEPGDRCGNWHFSVLY
jgi:hypothetical protein